MNCKKSRILFIFMSIFILISTLTFNLSMTVFGADSELESEMKVMGAVTGSTFDQRTQKLYPNVKVVYYDSYADMGMAVDSGKIDGFLMDEPPARILLNSNPNLQMTKLEGQEEEYALLFPKGKNKEIREELDAYIKKLKNDGTLKELDELWFGNDDAKKNELDWKSLPATNGTIKFAGRPDMEPFTYVSGDNVIGYDIDVMTRFCKEKGYALQVDTFKGSAGVIAALEGGKYTLGGGCVTVTEERKQ